MCDSIFIYRNMNSFHSVTVNFIFICCNKGSFYTVCNSILKTGGATDGWS